MRCSCYKHRLVLVTPISAAWRRANQRRQKRCVLKFERSGFGWKRLSLPVFGKELSSDSVSDSARFHFPNRVFPLWGSFFRRRPLLMTLHDKFGRQITDLRISVTDRCNFRCVYCRSADPENYNDHDEILSWPELYRLASHFPNAGHSQDSRHWRRTAGAPRRRRIRRPSCETLGVRDISMTTNGHLLAERNRRPRLPRVCIALISAWIRLTPRSFEKHYPHEIVRLGDARHRLLCRIPSQALQK